MIKDFERSKILNVRKKDCKLESAYKLPKTQQWLDSFDNFGEIVQWMNIDQIFVDAKNNIFDLEKNDGTIINEYCNKYDKLWSNNYYENIKDKIDKFVKKNNL